MKALKQGGSVLAYCAGFPCQPYSPQGAREGMADSQGRGNVVYGVLQSIAEALPDFFVLENVKALATDQKFRSTWEDILFILGSIKNGIYALDWAVLDSYQVGGVPATRERVYLVGVRKDRLVQGWRWPQPIPPPGLDEILVPRGPQDKIPLQSLSTSALQNLANAVEVVAKKGKSWATEPWVVDLMTSSTFGTNVSYNKFPTITKSHAQGLWLSHLQDKARLEEVLAAQGVHAGELVFPDSVPQKKLFEMTGNAFTATVFQRLFQELLPAVGVSLPK
eukprot:Skav236344  [mRNA]  locus=scaffold918:71711:72544:- [translate_table: standard]